MNTLGYRFTRNQRITRWLEFKQIYHQGKKVQSAVLNIYLFQSDSNNPPKLGIRTQKKIGSAVIRNRVKRNLREIFRLHQYQIKKGSKIILVAKPGIEKYSHSELDKMILQLLKKFVGALN